MRLRLQSYPLYFLAWLALTGSEVRATLPGPPSFASNYQMVFGQDFTVMTNISQLGVSATTIGTGTWVAHTPSEQDFFTFENPSANYMPFGVGSGYLDIRVQQDGNDPNNYFGGFSGGLLSSMDMNGGGFAQQYGYFECSMWTPGSPNTWPAFWLLSSPFLNNSNLPNFAEIDVSESYGNYLTGPNQIPAANPNENSVAWHNWGANGNATTQNGTFFSEPGMTTGYHTYGVDVEPTGITWYFDRQPIWQAPIFPAAEQPLLILLNLALGGGNYNNSTGTGYNWALTPNPTDLKVQYVAVWASPNSPNYTGSGAPATPAGLTATAGNSQVALNWSASSRATTYSIYRGTSSGGETSLTANITSTSYTDMTAVNGTTYYYDVVANDIYGASGISSEVSATPSANSPLPLPTPWLNADIGSPGASGSSTSANGTFTLNGAGRGAYYVPDAYQFAYQLVNGDCSITARIVTQADSSQYAHAGLIILDSLSDSAGLAEMILYPNGGGALFQYRPDSGSPSTVFGTGTAPYWVKLTRSGSTFTGSVSPDGTTWTTVGSTTLSMPSTVYIGLQQASGTPGSLAASTFDNVSVTGTSVNGDPAAPSGLTAIGLNSAATLQWSASSGAATYNVYRSTSSGSESILASGIAASSYYDPSVSNGTTYYYEVAAVNSSFTSGRSNEASATPTSNLPVPAAPSGLTATGGTSSVSLQWNASSGAGTYSVYRGTAAGGEVLLATGSKALAYTDSAVTNGTTYYYKVAAVNSAGTSSLSSEASATPVSGVTVPAAPTGLTATGGSGTVSLAWSASSGATSYSIYRGTTSGSESVLTSGITAASYSDSAVTNGTTYYYKVAAVNSAGTSSLSSEASATPVSVVTVPAAPTGLTATGGSGTVSLAWSASSGATSYSVYRGTTSGSESVLTSGITTASYSDSAVTNGTTYYYKVAAVNSAGTSSLSSEASATPVAAPGALPSPWLNQDVGFTWATGSSSYASGVFTLSGAGPGASYPPDGFQYAYQVLSGDGSIVARVVTQAKSSQYASAGVMIRDGLASNSGFADILLYPSSGGAYFQYRPDGGNPSTASGTGTVPYWVKLTRSGNTFTGFVSPDGATWTAVGSTTLTMSSTVYIGLLQASGIDGTLGTSTFDNVTIVTGTTVPAAPTGLTATGGSGTVSLAWSASSGATSYSVYRGTTSGSESVLTSGITAASYSDSAVTNGTTYYYKVTAVNSAGTSSLSSEASATPVAAVTVPAAPTGLTATGGSGTVSLAWSASSGATSYSVYRGTTSGSESVLTSGITAASYSDSAVTNGTTYYYKVAAVNSAGTSSLSSEASATPVSGVTVPAAPTGLTATAGAGKVSLAWSASSGATSYSVYRGTTSGSESVLTSGITTASYSDSAVTNGTTYYYKVAAVNSAGTSSLSSEASATPILVIPAAPTGLTATGGSGTVSLAWSASSGATSYSVYRGTTSGSESVLTSGITTASYSDSAVTNGTAYYYKVAAMNSAGTSSLSSEASATPVAAPGALPSPWLNQDVGFPWATGSSSYASGVFTLSGAGPGASYPPDGFQYAYQVLSGDGSIVARVVTQAKSSQYASAGVMIRDGLASNSGFADILLYPSSGGAYFQYRPDGGNPSTASGTGTVPYWVKLTRSGNTFTGFVSPDGATWTAVGSTTLTMSSTLYIGLLQASGIDGTLGTSTFDNVTIVTGTTVPAAPTGLTATGGSGTVSLAWSASSGATSYSVYRGTTSGSESVLTTGVTGASYSDSAVTNGTTYYYKVAAVNSAGTSSLSSEASATPVSGVTVPAAPTGLTATGGSGTVSLAWSASSGATSYTVYRGTTSGSESVLTTGVTAASYSDSAVTSSTTYYYKVAAVNSAGTSALSSEASATPVSGVTVPAAPTGLTATGGSGTVSLAWSASSGATSYSVYRGTTSGSESVLTSGITAASYSDSAVTNGTTYYYKVAAVNSAGTSSLSSEASATPVAAPGALPSPWLNQDVGFTWATGSSSYVGGVFTLSGAGAGAYYPPDSFQYAYQVLSGDCSIVARVVTQAKSSQYASAGVMIRDGLASSSGFADILLYPSSGGAYFQYRPDGGNPSTASGTGTVPYWVKLTRSGNTFTGFVSPDGATWTAVGSTTLTMPSTVYIGMLQTSGISGTLASSTFNNVTVTP